MFSYVSCKIGALSHSAITNGATWDTAQQLLAIAGSLPGNDLPRAVVRCCCLCDDAVLLAVVFVMVDFCCFLLLLLSLLLLSLFMMLLLLL